MAERDANPEAPDAWSYARIDLQSERWLEFVSRWELENWGTPRTLLAYAPRPVAPAAVAQWHVFLATDPPLSLGTSDAASLTRAFPVDARGWQPIPVAAALADAVAWAAEHVGPCVEAAGAARDRILRELDELPIRYRRIVAAGRELPEALLHERVPPGAMTAVAQGDGELDPDRVIEWLSETRTRVIEPLIPADGRCSTASTPIGTAASRTGSATAWSRSRRRTASGVSPRTTRDGSNSPADCGAGRSRRSSRSSSRRSTDRGGSAATAGGPG